MITEAMIEQIKERSTPTEEGCWKWNRSLTSAGYGNYWHDGEYWTAHRFSYVCVHGNLGKDEVVRHRCHNTWCCNPDHLVKGSQKDNYADSKGKHAAADKKRRKRWNVDGVEYPTCREAVEKTGISMHSMIKYTYNGKFNRSEYEENCLRYGKIPAMIRTTIAA